MSTLDKESPEQMNVDQAIAARDLAINLGAMCILAEKVGLGWDKTAYASGDLWDPVAYPEYLPGWYQFTTDLIKLRDSVRHAAEDEVEALFQDGETASLEAYKEKLQSPWHDVQKRGAYTVNDLITRLLEYPDEMRHMPILMPTEGWYDYIGGVEGPNDDGYSTPTLIKAPIDFDSRDL